MLFWCQITEQELKGHALVMIATVLFVCLTASMGIEEFEELVKLYEVSTLHPFTVYQ